MDDLGNLIQQLIDLVKQTAPELWRIALLQVKTQTIQCFIGLAISIPMTVFGAFHLAKAIKMVGERDKYEEDYWEEVAWFVSIALILIGFIATLAISMGLVGYLVNPEYAAIKTLIHLAQ